MNESSGTVKVILEEEYQFCKSNWMSVERSSSVGLSLVLPFRSFYGCCFAFPGVFGLRTVIYLFMLMVEFVYGVRLAKYNPKPHTIHKTMYIYFPHYPYNWVMDWKYWRLY